MEIVRNTSALEMASIPVPQPKSATGAMGENEDRFLRLLVAQLKNQDPLNPLDNAQVTTQLAQLSTVNGIEKINATLQVLVSSFAVTQSLQATSMLGYGVLIPGSDIVLEAGGGVGGVELTQPADKVVITIRNAAGTLLQQVDIGAQPAGVAAFRWDGAVEGGVAPDGVYMFSVVAMRGEERIDARPLTFGYVTAVAPSTQGALLTVGERGDVALAEVRRIVPK